MSFKNFIKSNIVATSLFLTCFTSGFVASNISWGRDQWVDIIESDAKGYYAYLPAVFIYHDLNFGFYNEIDLGKYYHKPLVYEYRYPYKGKKINKYYCGTAVAEMPFFFIAHIAAKMFGYPDDGYSKIYLVLINVAAIVYLLVGFIFLIKNLRFYNIPDKTIAFIIPVLAFGTNIFVNVVCDPGMSHIYSFAFFNIFIYCFKTFSITRQNKYLLWASLTLGIITLIRPINALLILCIPFLCGSGENFLKTFKHIFSKPAFLVLCLFAFGIIVSIQPIIYYLSCGEPFVYSYGIETFRFNDPHITDILFSYRKGLFLYTPVLMIALIGFIKMWGNNRFETVSLFMFLSFVIYLLSSWWEWWYGASFSSRPFLEFIPFFAIPFCFLLNGIKNILYKRILISVIVILTLICQVQIYQYRYYKINSQYMTKQQYWDEFLRIDKLIQ